MDSYERDNLLINVAKLYYEFDYNQGMIAEKYSISRPFVSKLLAEAKERGIVKIQVRDPANAENRLEREVRQKYELRRAIVVPSEVGVDVHMKVCVACGKYLNGIIKSGDIIGLVSGQTLNLSSQYLIPREDLSDVKVVSLEGGLGNLSYSAFQHETTKGYADALGAVPYAMPVPNMVDDVKCKEYLLREPIIQKIKKLQERANIAIFNVVSMATGKSMSMVRQGYVSEFRMKQLANEGAVSVILNHFIGRNGEIHGEDLEERNMSLGLDLLRQKEYRICLATGRERIDAVQAALNGGYINVLIIDENIAKGLLG